MKRGLRTSPHFSHYGGNLVIPLLQLTYGQAINYCGLDGDPDTSFLITEYLTVVDVGLGYRSQVQGNCSSGMDREVGLEATFLYQLMILEMERVGAEEKIGKRSGTNKEWYSLSQQSECEQICQYLLFHWEGQEVSKGLDNDATKQGGNECCTEDSLCVKCAEISDFTHWKYFRLCWQHYCIVLNVDEGAGVIEDIRVVSRIYLTILYQLLRLYYEFCHRLLWQLETELFTERILFVTIIN